MSGMSKEEEKRRDEWIKKYDDYFAWEAKYKPIGEFQRYGEDGKLIQKYDYRYVWSVCESGEEAGVTFIVNGLRGVNVSNYILTEFPCTEEDEDIEVICP
jgi:hypothetical protein